MNRRAPLVVLYLSGLLVGVAIVVFPAAGNLFRSAEAHQLTAAEYGVLFVPMIVAAITSSTLTGPTSARIGLARVYLGGLAMLVTAMALLALTAAFVHRHALAYRTLMVAHGALGLGFGATMTALNSYAPRLVPRRPQSALTALHAVVGLGTVLPPLALPRLAAAGAWWLFPAGLALLVAAVAAVAATLPLAGIAAPGAAVAARNDEPPAAPLWLFGVLAALYGLVEALFGDWASLFLHDERGLDGANAGLALSAFWAAVAAGRVTVALATRFVAPRRVHVALPLGMLAALALLRMATAAPGALAAALLGGLGCSSFLPLTIGAATAAHARRGESAAGLTFAAYLVGNGVGGSGVGLLRDATGLSIATLYGGGIAVAALLVVLAARATRPATRPSVALADAA